MDTDGHAGATSGVWRARFAYNGALDIIHLLGRRGAKVSYSDPYVSKLRADGFLPGNMEAIEAVKGAAEADCVAIVTDHKSFDYSGIVKFAKLVVAATMSEPNRKFLIPAK